jgi:DNA-directed RNA polymerase specialized sigma24 family protein
MPSTLDVGSTLSEYSSLIEQAAWVAFKKIRKPSAYDMEDLKSEGNVAAIKAINTFDESKGANIKTWIGFIVERHLYDLVWYSYRKIETIDVEEANLLKDRSSNSEDDICLLDLIEFRFSNLERSYIKLCLTEKMKDSKKFRETVRQKLKISEDIEDILRKSIRETLSERN